VIEGEDPFPKLQ